MDLHQGVATKALDITAAITKGVDSAAVAVFVEDPGVEAFADFAADNIKCKLIFGVRPTIYSGAEESVKILVIIWF